jgi:HSP20 family protein
MAKRRDNPFEGVTDFFSEMGRLRELGLGRHGYEHGHQDQQRTHATAWVPAADVFARGGDLVIRIELAGMPADEIDITFSDGVLKVSGERETEEDTGGPDSFYFRERFHGAFRRAITLPIGTKEDQISAEFENGLVEITVRGGAEGASQGRIELKDRSTGASVRKIG